MLDKEKGAGIVFYNNSKYYAPPLPQPVHIEISCGPRSRHTDEQLKFIQSLWRQGCRTKMKKNNVRVYLSYTDEGRLKGILDLLKENGIEHEIKEIGEDDENETTNGNS